MKVTAAAPLLYALEVPTLVAVPIVGATGTDLAPEALDPKTGIACPCLLDQGGLMLSEAKCP